MCGIVGALTTQFNSVNSNPVNRFFGQALFADTLRGDDSTGMFLLDLKGKMDKPDTFKRALAAPDFLQLKRTGNLLRDSNDYRIMIGHNRAATKGGVYNHTAHPFQIGNITMVHNGTIYNHRSLPGGQKFDVDSEAICNSINEQGIAETVKAMDGAFTLIYHDAEDDSINMVRNDDRPLAFGKVKGSDTILLSSEGNMLQWLAIRNGMSLESVVLPKPGELFKFWVHKDWKEWAKTPTVESLKLYTKPITTYQHNNNYGHNYAGGTGGKKPSSSTTTGGTAKTGTGTSEVRFPSKFEEELCDKISIDFDDEIIVENLKYDAYPSGSRGPNSYGRIQGTIVGASGRHSAIINGVHQSEWDRVGSDKIMAKIERVWESMQNPGFINVSLDSADYVLVSDKDLKAREADEAGDEGGTPEAEETFLGPNQKHYTRVDWEKLTSKGCAVCTGNVFYEDDDKTGWTHDNQPVCKECVAANDWTHCLN